jgi:hypothetical protein
MTELEIKSAVRARDGNRCTKCGMTNDQHKEWMGKSLHVHRVVPGSLYTVEGCVPLCIRCHRSEPVLAKGQPDLAHGGKRPVYAYIPAPLHAALKAYLASTEAPPMRKAMDVAFKEFLQARGFWPPPDES